MTPEVLATDYARVIGPHSTRAHDKVRYQYTSWDVLKEAIAGSVESKAHRKKIQEHIDEGRQQAAADMPQDLQDFIMSWSQKAIQLLAKDSPKDNPKEIFAEKDALKVFDAAIQRGGAIPLWLDPLKPGPGCKELTNCIGFVYSKYSDPEPPEPSQPKGKGGKGKGYGKDKGKDKGGKGGWDAGGGGAAAPGMDMSAMASMMATMMSGM